MSDVMSFAEIDGQHVELLPARTLLQTDLVGELVAGLSDPATLVGALGALGDSANGMTNGDGG